MLFGLELYANGNSLDTSACFFQTYISKHHMDVAVFFSFLLWYVNNV